VTAVFLLSPLGIYIQYLDEMQGASRSFTVATVIFSAVLMTTTGIALIFALNNMFRQHRQWMTRSYAVALVFLEVRVILGLFGLDQPFDWAITETVVWSCLAVAVLIGDLTNQWYELASEHTRRPSAPGAAIAVATPAE